MNETKKGLAGSLLAIAGMFGSFGDIEPRRENYSPAYKVEGTKKFTKGAPPRKNSRRRTHRRRYLCGKPWAR